MIVTLKKLSMLIMNSRKYNPEMLFLLYYPFHVTFQKIDCKKQVSLVFSLKILQSREPQNFATLFTISFGHQDFINFEELKTNFILTTFP